MRLLLITVPFALLAACGGDGADNAAANNAANAAATEPAANSATSANTMAAMDPARAGEIQECADDVTNELPAGTDVNAFCGCAVDRMRGMGEGERPAMEACAAQMGIQPNN
jgi:hypothetical protein